MSLLDDSENTDSDKDNKRLTTDDYERPVFTYTDKLTKDEIEEKLAEYTKVDNIENVPLGTHIRYFSKVGDTNKFRLGGNLINKSGLPTYVVLGSRSKTWSVQVKNTIFFRKISLLEIKKEYITLLEYKDDLIQKQGKRINDLVAMVKDLKKQIKTKKSK
jgi:hypothetical protein